MPILNNNQRNQKKLLSGNGPPSSRNLLPRRGLSSRRDSFQKTVGNSLRGKALMSGKAGERDIESLFQRINTMDSLLTELENAHAKGDKKATCALLSKMGELNEFLTSKVKDIRTNVLNKNDARFIAHEINNALGVVHLSLYVLNTNEGSVEVLAPKIRDAIRKAKKVKSSLQTEYQSVPVDLNKLLVNEQWIEDGFSTRLHLVPPTGHASLLGDPGKMEIAISTIVRNACQLGAKNVWIRVEEKFGNPQIVIENDGTYVEDKSDASGNMSKGWVFSGESTREGGTGLGLKNAKDIFYRQSINLAVESEKPNPDDKSSWRTRFVIRPF